MRNTEGISLPWVVNFIHKKYEDAELLGMSLLNLDVIVAVPLLAAVRQVGVCKVTEDGCNRTDVTCINQ
jgi:hypothetical protein